MARPLHYVSVALTLVVLAGFGLFAIDEMDGASDETTARLAGDPSAMSTVSAERQRAELRIAGDESAAPVAVVEQQREARNSSAREAIDDANDFLLKPFDSIVSADDNVWVRRGVPALLGLLLYGFLLSFGARFMFARG